MDFIPFGGITEDIIVVLGWYLFVGFGSIIIWAKRRD